MSFNVKTKTVIATPEEQEALLGKEKAAELKGSMEITMAVDNDAAARRAYASLGIPTKSKVSLGKFWDFIQVRHI